MIEFKPPYCAQGDLNIFSCDAIPSGLVEKTAEHGKHVLAHSETGHDHVINACDVKLFDQDEFISYLEVKEKSNVVHLRSFDTHKTIALPPGKYRIARQREYTPEGFRRAAD